MDRSCGTTDAIGDVALEETLIDVQRALRLVHVDCATTLRSRVTFENAVGDYSLLGASDGNSATVCVVGTDELYTGHTGVSIKFQVARTRRR